MAVSVMLIEPSGGGRDITRERIEQELEAHRIIHGIDEEKVSTIAAEHLYRQMFIIARGTPAVDGNDGRIKDYFPREAKIKYASKGNGGIEDVYKRQVFIQETERMAAESLVRRLYAYV